MDIDMMYDERERRIMMVTNMSILILLMIALAGLLIRFSNSWKTDPTIPAHYVSFINSLDNGSILRTNQLGTGNLQEITNWGIDTAFMPQFIDVLDNLAAYAEHTHRDGVRVHLYDAEAETELLLFNLPDEETMIGLALLGGGDQIAVLSSNDDQQTGMILRFLDYTGRITAAALLPRNIQASLIVRVGDTDRVAIAGPLNTGGTEWSVTQFSNTSGQITPSRPDTFTIDIGGRHIETMTFSPDGRIAVMAATAAGGGSTLFERDVETGITYTYEDSDANLHIMRLIWVNDNTLLAGGRALTRTGVFVIGIGADGFYHYDDAFLLEAGTPEYLVGAVDNPILTEVNN